MNDPRPTLDDAQAMQERVAAATAEFKDASADELGLLLAEFLTLRTDADPARGAAWLAEVVSRLDQLEGVNLGNLESPWTFFRTRWPEKTLPIFVRERQKEEYEVWLLGWISEPALSGKIEMEPAQYQWLPIPA